MKTLHNSDASGAKKNVSDIKFFGDGDMFKLLCKASSEKEGWMKSTKAMEIFGIGCVVQVTTHQTTWDMDQDVPGSDAVSESVCFVPGVQIREHKDAEGNVTGRSLAQAHRPRLLSAEEEREQLRSDLDKDEEDTAG